MTFLDNIADYLPDEADLTDNQTISELVSIDKHIIITGWSEKDWNSLNDCFSNAFSFCGTNKLSDKVSDFYCLELSLAAGDDSISDSDDVILINNLKPILNCCLKCFNNYINVALAYKIRVKEENGKTSDKISYYYQTRVTGNELEHQVELLRTELEKSIPQNINLMYNALVYKDISKHYLYPGIELVSGKIIEEHVLKYLSNKIKKSILFFDLPYSVLSNTFHLYHHPKNSFPLPILLKKLGTISYEELWKSEEWGEEIKRYDKYIPKTPILSYYTRDNEDGCIGPHIVLCPDNIEAVASDKYDVGLVYLIVLIHELAHAMMDKIRINGSMNSLFAHAMEESLANMITLKWFKRYNRKNIESVLQFIKSQSKIYRFGIRQFDANVDWKKWRNSYKNMHYMLSIWFDVCVRKKTASSIVKDQYEQVFFPFKKEFENYVDNLATRNKRSKKDIISRMNSIFNGYTPNDNKITIRVVEDELVECIDAIPRIVVSKKEYHNIALQILAVLFIKINKKIEDNTQYPTLRSIRSALVHYYSFLEEVISNATKPRAGKLSEQEAKDLKMKIGAFYDKKPNVICFTQKEVQDNFKQRLHSQDRLYNHKLLFPITLIVKLLTGPFVAEKWTYKTISGIDILTGISKKNRIKFKDVSFFMFSSQGIFVFNRKGEKFQVFTRKYKVIEIKPEPMKVHDFEQPLQSFAIDHVQPMQQLLESIDVTLVPTLKQLSDNFLSFITNHGQKYLKESWVNGHPSANGLDLLTSKTINDLANGYIKSLGSKKPNAGDLINDIKTLHADGGLELMDKFENGKKGGEVE